jgi:hypothetical protein
MTERALRIYKTIKKNRAILTNKKVRLTDRQAARIEQDNMMLYAELRKEVDNECRSQIKKD